MTFRILRFLLMLLAPIAWRWFKQRRSSDSPVDQRPIGVVGSPAPAG